MIYARPRAHLRLYLILAISLAWSASPAMAQLAPAKVLAQLEQRELRIMEPLTEDSPAIVSMAFRRVCLLYLDSHNNRLYIAAERTPDRLDYSVKIPLVTRRDHAIAVAYADQCDRVFVLVRSDDGSAKIIAFELKFGKDGKLGIEEVSRNLDNSGARNSEQYFRVPNTAILAVPGVREPSALGVSPDGERFLIADVSNQQCPLLHEFQFSSRLYHRLNSTDKAELKPVRSTKLVAQNGLSIASIAFHTPGWFLFWRATSVNKWNIITLWKSGEGPGPIMLPAFGAGEVGAGFGESPEAFYVLLRAGRTASRVVVIPKLSPMQH